MLSLNHFIGDILKTRKNESGPRGTTEYKHGTYVYQPIAQVDAPKIQELNQLLYGNSYAWRISIFLGPNIFIDAYAQRPGITLTG